MRVVSFRSIENSDNSISLHDLYKEDFTPFQTPFLEFPNAEGDDKCWDNDEYLIKFFRGIKKSKKKYIKELQKFCEENGYDYQSTLEDLLDIYHSSKKLKFWGKK